MAESYPGYEVVPWYGFVAPAGTPPAVVNKLNEAITGVSIAAITPRLLDDGQRADEDVAGRIPSVHGRATWS